MWSPQMEMVEILYKSQRTDGWIEIYQIEQTHSIGLLQKHPGIALYIYCTSVELQRRSMLPMPPILLQAGNTSTR